MMLLEDLAADRLKNAAATKKLAIFDAFEILTRIEQEKNILKDSDSNKINLEDLLKVELSNVQDKIYIKVLDNYIKPNIVKKYNIKKQWKYGL